MTSTINIFNAEKHMTAILKYGHALNLYLMESYQYGENILIFPDHPFDEVEYVHYDYLGLCHTYEIVWSKLYDVTNLEDKVLVSKKIVDQNFQDYVDNHYKKIYKYLVVQELFNMHDIADVLNTLHIINVSIF